MRLLAVAILTLSQFTIFPFLAIVSANTERQSERAEALLRNDLQNVTTIYKTAAQDTRFEPRG
jgi:hypothetical protein